jgi:DNA-binding LacI/PurR family transcriptional regulator
MNRRPTLKDVAKHANVSIATVSVVVNNTKSGNISISEETCQRVLAAIEEIGYVPNLAARSLRTSKTRLLAVMVQDLTNPFFPFLVRGAQETAESNNYELLVYDCINFSGERERAFVNLVMRRRVDGVVMVIYQSTSDILAPLYKNKIPVVTIGPEWPEFDSVILNDTEAIKKLVLYLKDKGHIRIAHLMGKKNTPPADHRMQGYRQGLDEAGLKFDASLVRFGSFTKEDVAEQISPLFIDRSSNHPTALIVANDVMAIEAIQVLKSWGYHIPQDVAVTGFDNIPESKYIIPSLTTVENCARLMGQKSVERLLLRLSSDVDLPVERICLEGEIIFRESA